MYHIVLTSSKLQTSQRQNICRSVFLEVISSTEFVAHKSLNHIESNFQENTHILHHFTEQRKSQFMASRSRSMAQTNFRWKRFRSPGAPIRNHFPIGLCIGFKHHLWVPLEAAVHWTYLQILYVHTLIYRMYTYFASVNLQYRCWARKVPRMSVWFRALHPISGASLFLLKCHRELYKISVSLSVCAVKCVYMFHPYSILLDKVARQIERYLGSLADI